MNTIVSKNLLNLLFRHFLPLKRLFHLKYLFFVMMAQLIKNLPANAGDMRCGFDPCVWKIPWKREWHPTPVFLPGESHGRRSLAGSSP